MSFNLTPQSSSAFQNDIINQIIAVLNGLGETGMEDSDFLSFGQRLLFAGTFLPGTSANSMSWQPSDTTRTNWVIGGGNNTTAPIVTLNSNSVAVQNANVNTLSSYTLNTTTLNVTGNSNVNFGSLSVNGSSVITQATLPTIPQAPTAAFGTVTVSGNFSGSIGIAQFGTVLTMDINIQVTTAFSGWATLIAQTNTTASFNQLCNRLRAGGMQTPATVLDQWIAGNNGNNDVRAITQVTSGSGLQIQGVTGGLNVGDQFNVMITWAVDQFG